MSGALEASGLHHGYRDREVLKGVDFRLHPGEIVALLGRNGAGKSTLLRLLLGIDRPTRGEVCFDGMPLASLGRRRLARSLAYVPQSHSAPFPYQVREVVMMGRVAETGLFTAAADEDHEIVADTLARLHITHLAERPYTQISGGERQLTLIARAMAQGGRLLVMDEPVSGLDYGNQIRLLERLHDLARGGYGILMTTHHPDQALSIATRVCVLDGGVVTHDGRPADVVTAATLQALYEVSVKAVDTECGHRLFVPALSGESAAQADTASGADAQPG